MGWRVLLLDDNARSAVELDRGLAEVGCEVVAVTDKKLLGSAKSLSRLTSDRVDAVLVSVSAPRHGGLALFDRIHKDTRARGVPVVLVGAEAAVLAEHEASAAPAEGYVRRPAEHEGLVVELGAALLGVVGAGTRTVPPPAPAEPADASTPDVGVEARPSVRGGTSTEELTQPRVPAEARESTKRPRVVHEDPEPTAPFRIASMTARDADEKAARIEHLETEVARMKAAVEAEEIRRDADRAAHEEAMAVAIADSEAALADERAMGEAALTSMAAELHAQSARFGKRVTDANARAHAAEERLKAERGGSVSSLADADANLAAMQRELVETRETLAKDRARLEEDLRLERAERADLALSEERKRADHDAEHARAAAKLTAAAAAFDRKQRELVETRETMGKRVALLEREFHLAHGAREQAVRELREERARHEALAETRVRETEERLGEERESVAATLAAKEALFEAREHELVREMAAKEERAANELIAERASHEAALASAEALAHELLAAAEEKLHEETSRGALAIEAERVRHTEALDSALASLRRSHEAALASAESASNALLAAAEQRLLDEIAGGAFALEAAADAATTARQELLETEAAATKQTGELEEELRRSWTEYDAIAAQREQLRYALEVVQSDLHVAVEERDALRAAAGVVREEPARGTATLASAEAVKMPVESASVETERRLAAAERRLAEAAHEKTELRAELDREIAMRRKDQDVAVAALRSAEERIAALEARAAPLSRPGDRISTGSGELRASRQSIIPESDGTRSIPPISGIIRESRRSSGPPPAQSGSRAAARVPVPLEGDRDDSSRPAGRSVLLIDSDRTARINTARALARASCEVTVRDSCADIATSLRTFDVIVTEVVDVAIDQLVTACRERVPTCAILVWTPGADGARALFTAAGVEGVTVLQKAYRADELVNAVRARLDRPAKVASG